MATQLKKVPPKTQQIWDVAHWKKALNNKSVIKISIVNQ